jgi:hypothetical protein
MPRLDPVTTATIPEIPKSMRLTPLRLEHRVSKRSVQIERPLSKTYPCRSVHLVISG